MLAALFGHAKCVSLLLKANGVDVQAVDEVKILEFLPR